MQDGESPSSSPSCLCQSRWPPELSTKQLFYCIENKQIASESELAFLKEYEAIVGVHMNVRVNPH